MSESIVRQLDNWKISATEMADGSWFVEAFDTTWALSKDAREPDLEQALAKLAPKIQLDFHELKRSFGL